MGCSFAGFRGTASGGPFLVFFPKTSPGPRGGRPGTTAAEYPRPAGRAGPEPREGRRVGIARAAVARQRCRSGRSASGIFPPFSLPI